MKGGRHLKINVSVPNLRLFVGNIPKSKGNVEIMEEFSKVTGNTTWHNSQSFSLYPPIRNLQQTFFRVFQSSSYFFHTWNHNIVKNKTKNNNTCLFTSWTARSSPLFLCHNLLSLAPAYGNSIGLLPAVRFLSLSHFDCYWICETIESVQSIHPSSLSIACVHY